VEVHLNASLTFVLDRVVTCTFRPLYSRARNTQCRLNERLSEPRSQWGHFGGEKSRLPLLAIEPRFRGQASRSLVTVPTQLISGGGTLTDFSLISPHLCLSVRSGRNVNDKVSGSIPKGDILCG
jgi:hypothetical protein